MWDKKIALMTARFKNDEATYIFHIISLCSNAESPHLAYIYESGTRRILNEINDTHDCLRN